MNKFSKGISGTVVIRMNCKTVWVVLGVQKMQFVSGINEEAPPGVFKQLVSGNIAVYWATAGISMALDS